MKASAGAAAAAIAAVIRTLATMAPLAAGIARQSTISQSQASCAANTATCAPDPSSRGRPRLIIGAALTSGAGKIGAEGATARGQVPPGPNASASTTVCTGEIRGGPGPVS